MTYSFFKIIRKSSKAISITAATKERKLTASTLETAIAEARTIANEETSVLDVVYVTDFSSFTMKTVRPSRQAMADYNAWRAQRAERNMVQA